LAEDIKDDNNNIVISKGELILKENAQIIEDMAITSIKIRTSLTCESLS